MDSCNRVVLNGLTTRKVKNTGNKTLQPELDVKFENGKWCCIGKSDCLEAYKSLFEIIYYSTYIGFNICIMIEVKSLIHLPNNYLLTGFLLSY